MILPGAADFVCLSSIRIITSSTATKETTWDKPDDYVGKGCGQTVHEQELREGQQKLREPNKSDYILFSGDGLSSSPSKYTCTTLVICR